MRMPRLFPLAILAITIAGVAAAASPAGASSKVGVSHVQEVNISDQSFSLSFITSAKVSKVVMLWGTSCKRATAKAAEVRGGNGIVHLVNAPGGLTSAATYWVKLRINGAAYNTCYRMHTYSASTVPPPPNAIYGFDGVAAKCGKKTVDKAAAGSLVVLDVSHNGAPSDSLATLADSKGRWALPFGDATTQSGAWVNPGQSDVIDITGWQDKSHSDVDHLTYNGTSKTIGPWNICMAHK